MIIELDIPEDTIRKIKAYAVLNGMSTGLTDALMGLIDQTVTEQIVKAVKPGETFATGQVVNRQVILPPPRIKTLGDWQSRDEDVSGISQGLGDEDDFVEERAADPMRVSRGGIKDKDLENDMSVDDPEHEVKVDASSIALSKDKEAEDIFAEVANMPPPPKPARERRRKKTLNSKAKVTEFFGDESSE